jgi:hypothetical protein
MWSFLPQAILSSDTHTSALAKNEEEQNKQLCSYFMSDPAVMIFDNQNGEFKSQALTEFITSGGTTFRVLGGNTLYSVNSKTSIIINGINVVPSKEMDTRTIIVEFDRRVNREFRYPRLLEHVIKERRELIKAALKLLLNGLEVGGKVKMGEQSRFYEWDEFVRRAVIAAGFIDPMREDLRGSVVSGEEEAKVALVEWLYARFSNKKFKSADINKEIGFDTDMQDLIKAIAHRYNYSSVVIGTAIGNIKGAEVSGHRLEWRKSGKDINVGEFVKIV